MIKVCYEDEKIMKHCMTYKLLHLKPDWFRKIQELFQSL